MTADVLVVGSGAAGLAAAGAAAAAGAEAVVVTDRGLGTANSALAQGGIQYPEADSAALGRFADDIRRSADAPVDATLVERFTAEVRPTVDELIALGLVLDVDDDGNLVRRLAGGMSEPRVVTAGDRIGGPVLRVLRSQVTELGVEVSTRTAIVDVVPERGHLRLVAEDGADLRARAVVVATGGTSHRHAQLIGAVSSNPDNRNHVLSDALRERGLGEVGADWFQFQPFGWLGSARAGGPGPLVPESVVELGVRLLDADGSAIVDAMAGRRVVTEAIHTAIAEGRGTTVSSGETGVVLSLGDVPVDVLGGRYLTLSRRLDAAGLLGSDVVVAPFVHYQLGGFVIAPDCSTNMPGLFLAGELTGGVHGRNRLMGNGLTDSLVHGRRAGRSAADYSRSN